jgi:hypothetical protein
MDVYLFDVLPALDSDWARRQTYGYFSIFQPVSISACAQRRNSLGYLQTVKIDRAHQYLW